jgi:CRP-like cAMP-binding protein
MRKIEFSAGETIITEGDPSTYCYLIISGIVEIQLERRSVASAKRAVPVEEFKAGEMFGEMSIIDEGPHSATAIAKQPTVCAAYTRDELLDLIKTDPEEAFQIMLTLVRRLRKMNRKLARQTHHLG